MQNGNRMQKRKKLKIADQYLIPEFTMSFFGFYYRSHFSRNAFRCHKKKRRISSILPPEFLLRYPYSDKCYCIITPNSIISRYPQPTILCTPQSKRNPNLYSSLIWRFQVCFLLHLLLRLLFPLLLQQT